MTHTFRILLATALVSLGACQAARMGAPMDEIPSTAVDEEFSDTGVRRLYHSYSSGFNSPARLVIRDQESWREAWTTLYIGMSPSAVPPTVDFTRSTVILVALGSRSTGGYDITVSRVARDANVVYVQVTSTSPGDRCFTTQAFTQPVDVIVLPHVVAEAVFVERKLVRDC